MSICTTKNRVHVNVSAGQNAWWPSGLQVSHCPLHSVISMSVISHVFCHNHNFPDYVMRRFTCEINTSATAPYILMAFSHFVGHLWIFRVRTFCAQCVRDRVPNRCFALIISRCCTEKSHLVFNCNVRCELNTFAPLPTRFNACALVTFVIHSIHHSIHSTRTVPPLWFRNECGKSATM